jgi:hypothetical protein
MSDNCALLYQLIMGSILYNFWSSFVCLVLPLKWLPTTLTIVCTMGENNVEVAKYDSWDKKLVPHFFLLSKKVTPSVGFIPGCGRAINYHQFGRPQEKQGLNPSEFEEKASRPSLLDAGGTTSLWFIRHFYDLQESGKRLPTTIGLGWQIISFSWSHYMT